MFLVVLDNYKNTSQNALQQPGILKLSTKIMNSVGKILNIFIMCWKA